MKKIESDFFDVINEIQDFPQSSPILIIDGVLTENLPIGSIVVFDMFEKIVSEIKFTTLSHNLSVLDIISMNQNVSKRKLQITFLGIVIENVDYGEVINDQVLNKKNFVTALVKKFCNNSDIKGIYT